MIDYPNYFPNYDPDLPAETFRPISLNESPYRISKFPDSFDTNSPPNECSQVGSEQVLENQSVSESITPKVIRRGVDAIILSRSDILPYDMPKGPWKSHMTAKLDLNEWALDLATGCGRFSLVWTSTYTSTSRKGKQRVLSCYRAIKGNLTNEKRKTISQRYNCPYTIRLEESIQGWTIVQEILATITI